MKGLGDAIVKRFDVPAFENDDVKKTVKVGVVTTVIVEVCVITVVDVTGSFNPRWYEFDIGKSGDDHLTLDAIGDINLKIRAIFVDRRI